MSSATIAKLGIIFLGLGFSATFLMYWLWGFPFNKETRTSEAPKPLMYTHRVLGYLFVITYIAIMWHMVPRLWYYQVEFPARTVAHVILGISVGFMLMIKISIMRFFRHFEEWMPYLGTGIMFGTVLLLGLSVPFFFHARVEIDDKVIARVERLLPGAELPEGTDIAELASEEGLRKGRAVLLTNCVRCHDLRTILAKPRTPSNWHRTVVRMAEKPTLFDAIEKDQQLHVTSYLVAITPDLQKSLKKIRTMEKEMKEILAASAGQSDMAAGNYDPKQAKEVYEETCSQCHELSDVDGSPPKAGGDIAPLIERMIENGMEAEPAELATIKWYLLKHFVEGSLK